MCFHLDMVDFGPEVNPNLGTWILGFGEGPGGWLDIGHITQRVPIDPSNMVVSTVFRRHNVVFYFNQKT